jgi:histidyl-tRNA synthetase
LSKNLEYCNSKGVPKMIIVGPKDLENNKVTIRNMLTGKEDKIDIKKIVDVLKR